MTTKNDISKDKKDKLRAQLEELEKLQSEDGENGAKTRDESAEFYFTEISPIQIYIQSNIPDKKPWLLKRSDFITNFVRPSSAEPLKDYSEFPYFTNEVEYPTKSLYKMEPYEIFDFFFSRSYFEYKLNYIIFRKGRGTIPPNEPGAKRRAEYNRKNIMTMLQLLFTTVYPRTNNISNSIDEFIRKQTNPLNLNRILAKPLYTYMKIDGREYTLLKLVWLNDLFNHPKYNKMADEYINYKYWCISQSKTIQKKIDDNIQKIENLLVGFDFTELLEILNKKTADTDKNKQRAMTFEQEVFQTNVVSLNKILNIMNSYRIFIKGGKQDVNTFLKEARQYSAVFQPYSGQIVEVKLDELEDINIKSVNNKTNIDNIKQFWYYGKISKKDDTAKANENKYIVQVFYLNRNDSNPKSIEVSIDIDNIREPILPKILENKKFDKDKLVVEKLRDKDEPFGIDFDDHQLNGNTFYYNINNVLIGRKVKYRNDGIFEDVKSKLTMAEYKDKPQLYRYKITQDEDQILQNLRSQIDRSPSSITNLFLSYLDMLDETYNKVKSNMNFNSRMKGFIEGVVRLHKIILPIKAINDLYLNNYKIDIQHKDIATKDTATELTPYKDFANFMMDYLAPKMESSNPDLQSFILSYAENIAGENFIRLMDILETCYSDKKPICRVIKNKQRNEAVFKYIDTGVNYINMDNKSKPQYEVFLQANFVLGHLDNANWRTIKCSYNDESLTRRFNGLFSTRQLVGDWMVTPDPFVEIGVGVPKEVPKEEPKKAAKEVTKPATKKPKTVEAIPVAEAVPVSKVQAKPLTKKSKGGWRQRKNNRTRRRDRK